MHKNSCTAAEMLLEKANIATIPGSVFGAQGEGHLRFSYAVTIREIEDCIDALCGFIAEELLMHLADGAAGLNARGAKQPRNLLQVELYGISPQDFGL